MLYLVLSVIGPVDSGKTSFINKLISISADISNTTTEAIYCTFLSSKVQAVNYGLRNLKTNYLLLDTRGHSYFVKERSFAKIHSDVVILLVDSGNRNYKVLDEIISELENKKIILLYNKIDKFFEQKNPRKTTKISVFLERQDLKKYYYKLEELETFLYKKGHVPKYFSSTLILEEKNIYIFPTSIEWSLGIIELLVFLNAYASQKSSIEKCFPAILGGLKDKITQKWFLQLRKEHSKDKLTDHNGERLVIKKKELIGKNLKNELYLLQLSNVPALGTLQEKSERVVYSGRIIFVDNGSKKTTIEEYFLKNKFPYRNVIIGGQFQSSHITLFNSLQGLSKVIFTFEELPVQTSFKQEKFLNIINFLDSAKTYFFNESLKYLKEVIGIAQPSCKIQLYSEKYLFRDFSPVIIGGRILEGSYLRRSELQINNKKYKILEVKKDGRQIDYVDSSYGDITFSLSGPRLKRDKDIIITISASKEHSELLKVVSQYDINIANLYKKYYGKD